MHLRLIASIALALIVLAPTAWAADLAVDLDAGTRAGFGGQVSGLLTQFTPGAPLALRAGLGYFSHTPTNPYDARHVFINDNTNGTPEKTGHLWTMNFDLLVPVGHFGMQTVTLVTGVRYSHYTAHFQYIGGNESFDVVGNPWGVGLGLETAFRTGDHSAFVLKAGVDHYFDAELTGHDTTYAPDGVDVNPRDGYTYDDAKAATNPPTYEIVGMIGWRMGLK